MVITQKTRSFTMNDATYERIRAIANSKGLSISALIRLTFLTQKKPIPTNQPEDRAVFASGTASSSIQNKEVLEQRD